MTSKIKKISICSIKELMNIKADKLAKLALLHTHSSDIFFDCVYPHNNFIISFGGKQSTGPIPLSTSIWLQKYHLQQGLWPYDGIRRAMARYPTMIHVFVFKQVFGWCGSNSKQSFWNASAPISNMCPNCGLSGLHRRHQSTSPAAHMKVKWWDFFKNWSKM